MTKRYVIIGGSAGSFNIILQILENLNKNFLHPIVLILHRLKNVRYGFDEAINLKSKLPVVEPKDKDMLHSGYAYLAPANYHLLFNIDKSFVLSTEETYNHSRPSIDLAFYSAAEAFEDKAIGILLSGANRDGARGLYEMYKAGGITIVQDPEEAQVYTMPKAALNIFNPHYVLTSKEIINFIKNLYY